MRFNPQTITVTDNKDRASQIDALVALHDDDTAVGLAVHPVYILGPGSITAQPDEYTITHVPSGVRLHRVPVPTEDTARRWLALIAPLADWTQSSGALHTLDTLRLRVWITRAQALGDCENDREEMPPVSAPPLFRRDALTPLLEWISYAMEYVALPQEALPSLEAMLCLHTDLARQDQGIFPQALPCIWRFASCRRAFEA